MCVWDGEAGAVAGAGSGGEAVGTPPTESVTTTTTTTTTDAPVITTDAPATTTDAPETTPGAAMVEDETSEKNIVDVATGAGDFNTLVAAVTAAGLVDTLSFGGPYTVLGKIWANAVC